MFDQRKHTNELRVHVRYYSHAYKCYITILQGYFTVRMTSANRYMMVLGLHIFLVIFVIFDKMRRFEAQLETVGYESDASFNCP